MAYKLPELGFKYNALEPYIDAETMEIHHTKHHAKYLKNFNEAIENTDLETKTPTEIFANISKYNTKIRNNGGGFFNHSLFWQILTPFPGEELDANLSEVIKRDFGTIDSLKEQFSDAAANQFGSGWAWLIRQSNGLLEITSTPNQDNPLMDITAKKGVPILCLDVWEHAYYLKYQNNRAEYIKAFWNVVNWQKVAQLFNE